MPAQLGPVLVCKESSKPYRAALSSNGFEPYFLQVLDTGFVNEELLRQTINDGPDGKFNGVILTSSRAAEAWINALNHVSRMQDPSSTSSWNEVIFYVVGKATTKTLQSSSIPASKILGGDSGTGEALARFIVANHKSQSGADGAQPSLLLLTGDKNRETIPDILTEAGFDFHKLQVYETTKSTDLEGKLLNILQVLKDEKSAAERPWIVFFSPSTFDFVISALSTIQTGQSLEVDALSSFRIASIGPTTATHIRNLGYEVAVTAPKPDPVSLVESLCSTVVSL